MSSLSEVFDSGKARRFRGAQLREIAFPLGGIGTGTVSLGGRGQFRDWEIFNRPSKGCLLPYTFAAVWAQEEGEQPVTRVLEERLSAPLDGASGPPAQTAPGLPRMAEAIFTGAYPCARVELRDPAVPVQAELVAFNPLIPLDPDDSGLPVAVLRYRLRNVAWRPVQATVALSLTNPIGSDGVSEEYGGNRNEWVDTPALRGLRLTGSRHAADSSRFGSLALVTTWPQVSHRLNWLPPGGHSWGWSQLVAYWEDLSADGRLQDLLEAEPSPEGGTHHCALALSTSLEPGETVDLPFLLAWHFPHRTVSGCGWPHSDCCPDLVGNYYATRFADAWAVAEYTAAHLAELEAKTARFVRSVLDSSLPDYVLDAALSNASTLRTQTCLRTADGEFHGFEGCGDQVGCCHGSCTHVWNYEQTTALLFPTLARSMRNTEFLNDTDERGLMSFRTNLPLGSPRWGVAAADGQMGCLLKLYREWQLSGDTDWLGKLWPQARAALEFAWVPGGWDADQDGVMEGLQHNTYDIEWHGPNPQTGFWYLGALRAGEEMARALGETGAAARYRDLFERGSRWWDETLFNGEYYQQQVIPQGGRPVAEGLQMGLGALTAQDPPYQSGPGCLVDQLVGQFFASLVGLGDLADPEHLRSAFRAIYRYNLQPDLLDTPNFMRLYAANEEAATLICTWPRGGRPAVAVTFADEAMTGFEHAAGVGMISQGLVEEGLRVIRAVRDRFEGEKRNPWNEFECGHHYARAMAAWGGILALSGFAYSAVQGRMAFAPRISADDFRCFWSTPTAWGSFGQRLTAAGMQAWLAVEYGELCLRELALARPEGPALAAADCRLGTTPVAAQVTAEGGELRLAFPEGVTLREGETLTVAGAL